MSAEFKACRDAIASDLRAIDCVVRVQEDFRTGPRSLIESLEEYIAECDRVIVLLGDAYGAEASGTAVPLVTPLRSYTQWEYFLTVGERLNGVGAQRKDFWLYVASDRFLREHPVTQSDEYAQRQRAFRDQVLATGKHWAAFDSVDQLCRLVLRDGWSINERPLTDVEPVEIAELRQALARDTTPALDNSGRDSILRFSPQTLDAYRVARWAEWSHPRYALDKRFTRLTLLVDQGPEAQGVRWQAQRSFDDLRNVLADVAEPAVVVLGPPGCGKSTLLRRLELDLAVDALRADGTTAPLSAFFSLNRYRPQRPGEPLPEPRDWLEREWARRCPRLPQLDELLHRQPTVLLLDAINEMPHAGQEDYHERITRWREFLADLARHAPGTRAVLSCRGLDYSASLSTPDGPVPHVRIESLTDEQVEEFLMLYDPERGGALWRRLKGTVYLDLFRSPYYLKLLLAQPQAEASLLHGRAALFTGFVRQALTREVEAGSTLFQPGKLMHERDHQRVVQHEWPDRYALPSRGRLFLALSRLAYGLQERRGAGEVAQVRASIEEALALFGEANDEDLVRAGVDLQVLELQWDDVFFVHQLLQEYFAARGLAADPRPELARTAWRAGELVPTLPRVLETLADSDPLPQAPTTGWEQTFALAAAMAKDADAFVAPLLELNLPLAGQCVAQPDVTISPALRSRVREALLARSRDPDADLRARIAAARSLAEVGNPRFERRRGPDGEYLLAPMAKIAAGTYRIGSEEGMHDDEAPVSSVTLGAFEIGRFPVTNAEWRCFLEAGGYDDERWWDTETARAWRRGEGAAEGPKKEWRELWRALRAKPGLAGEWLAAGRITSQQAKNIEAIAAMTDGEVESQLAEWYPAGRQDRPALWSDPAFNHPSQPVVGVCWYEARAYCAWFSAQRGQEFRLPTEAEWEAAARGREGRRFAWGDYFDPSRCNAFETHIRRTSPVGVFPGGESTDGTADMTGNVWDWSASLYRPYPYDASDGREDAQADGKRVVRGGSWLNGRGSARCACRLYSGPGERYDDLGFRVVRVSPI